MILYDSVLNGYQCPQCNGSVNSIVGESNKLVAKCLKCNCCYKEMELAKAPPESDGITRPPALPDQTKIHPDDLAADLKRIKEEEATPGCYDCNMAYTPPAQPPTVTIDGLVCSNDTLTFHLIPEIAIRRLCERIALGEKTKGKDAWNALSKNQDVLKSAKALARRLGHGINHSYKLLAKIQNNEPWTEEDEKEASAVMWAGMFAVCCIAAQRKEQENASDP